MRTHPCTIAFVLTLALMCGTATAQATYLDEVASDSDATRGEARLLHYLEDDLPIEVHIEMPDRVDAAEVRDRVVAAPITRHPAWPASAPTPSVSRSRSLPSKRSTRQAILDVPTSRTATTPRCIAARRMFRMALCDS